MNGQQSTNTALETYYEQEFIPRAHRVGRGTLLLAMGLCLLPALYLSFVLDAWPGISVVLAAFLAVAAFVGIVWLVEPISYFPMLGVAGSYMSFLSGNIGNMRLPVVISCQTAIGAEQGSKKAEVAAVIGIAVSVLVNLAFLIPLVLIGQALIDAMPDAMAVALKNYTLPVGLTGVIVAIVVLTLPISAIFATTAAGVLGILVSFALARHARSNQGSLAGNPA
jgi:hypothetical protein